MVMVGNRGRELQIKHSGMEGGPGQPGWGWSSHLIHCKLVLGLAQLPVAGGELTNEVVAAMRPGVGEK